MRPQRVRERYKVPDSLDPALCDKTAEEPESEKVGASVCEHVSAQVLCVYFCCSASVTGDVCLSYINHCPLYISWSFSHCYWHRPLTLKLSHTITALTCTCLSPGARRALSHYLDSSTRISHCKDKVD